MKEREAAAAVIEQRVLEFKGSRQFAHARGSGRTAHLVRTLLKDIECKILPKSSRRAMELIEKLLTLGEFAWEGADDRDGSVELALRNACKLWLTAAVAFKKADRSSVEAQSATEWIERLYALYMYDPEGACDQLLSRADSLLDLQSLRALAARFEELLPTGPAVIDGEFDDRELKAVAALILLAEALRDPALYERAIRVYLPEPAELEARDIAIRYLHYGDPGGAVKWLQRPWSEPLEMLRYALLDSAYQATGERVKQIQVRRERYQKIPSLAHFQALQELLPDEELSGVRERVAADAARALDIGTGVRLLLGVRDIQGAEDLLVLREAELEGSNFEFLTPLAEDAEREGAWLVATVLWRAMLDDVLDRSRARAYEVAAGYLRSLRRIAPRIAGFRGLKTHVEYEVSLRLRHDLKSQFWRQFDEAITD